MKDIFQETFENIFGKDFFEEESGLQKYQNSLSNFKEKGKMKWKGTAKELKEYSEKTGERSPSA